MIYLGFDPGISGAMAAYTAGRLQVKDMPVVKDGKSSTIDLAQLAHLVLDLTGGRPTVAVVERVGAMPGQGVSSMFNFGRSYGGIQGVLAGLMIPVTLVTPQEWKRAMRVPAEKAGSRARASQIFPAYAPLWARVKDDGRAEAAMLALWLAQREQNAALAGVLS